MACWMKKRKMRKDRCIMGRKWECCKRKKRGRRKRKRRKRKRIKRKDRCNTMRKC